MGGAAGQDMGLTEREQEVLHLIAEGYTDAAIGAELHISIYTAQNHVKSILRKLNARNRTQASTIYLGGMTNSSH